MKTSISVIGVIALLTVVTPAWAATTSEYHESAESTDHTSASYDQLISVEAGPIHPGSLDISNGSYDFRYGDASLDSYLLEIGWSANLFHFLGSVHLKESLALTRFSGGVQGSQIGAGDQTMAVNLIGFDTRISHDWDWFPWKSLVPFVEAGYQYTLYYQSGSSDLESAQGGVGNAVAGAGLRLWLNRSASLSGDHVNRYAAFPVFLTARVNRIFTNPGGLDLASTSFMGGVSFGL